MQQPLDIGVDVAKQTVVAACAAKTFPPRTLKNHRTALKRWLSGLPEGSRIGLESTGDYHERLADLAVSMGFCVYVLNPRDTRHYAGAVGRRAKTDRVDAELLARFVAHEHGGLHPYVPPSPTTRRIDKLVRRRGNVVTEMQASEMSFKGIRGFAKELRALARAQQDLIDALQREIDELTENSPEHASARRKVLPVPGIGPVLGAALPNAVMRHPFKNADAFIASTGLDPRARDSGNKRGRRKLSKRGPAELRRLLYAGAMSAAQTATWRPVYEHYLARGWPKTAVLVIIARKIARIAFSIIRHDTEFDPKRIMPSLT